MFINLILVQEIIVQLLEIESKETIVEAARDGTGVRHTEKQGNKLEPDTS